MDLVAASTLLLKALVALLGKAAGAAIGEKVKDWLKSEDARQAYERALMGALGDLQIKYPDLAASFFDEHFLRNVVASELALMFTRHQRPSAERISEAYSSQFHSSGVEALNASEFFLGRLDDRMKEEVALRALVDSRQIEEIHRILSSMQGLRVVSDTPLVNEGPAAAEDDGKISEVFRDASNDLLSWPQTLDDGRWIHRGELELLEATISTTERSTTMLLGPPGSGKSALMARLVEKCLADGLEVLALKADQLPEDIRSLPDLQRWLGLEDSLPRALELTAARNKTLLVIDQLDALSELIDLRTGRLAALMMLIRKASEIQNLHIVCSCRIFERKYDARLNRIDAEEIQLPILAWKTVADILRGRGVDADAWPEEFRGMLCYPQHLKIFLRYFATASEQAIFNTYQAMLEHLWRERLFRTPEHASAAQVLNRIAADMSGAEILHAPSARYEAHRRELDYLVSVGILQYDREGRQVSFTHQTIFDFARARVFVSQAGALSQFALERQTGLFVRPKLWSALAYLRATDEPTYRKEFLALWNAPQLREHLRLLLIDFAGMQDIPLAFEIQALRGKLTEPRYRGKVLGAIAGKQAWFDEIKTDLLPAIMNMELAEAWPARLVLQQAWQFAKQDVLRLLDRHWLADLDKRYQAFTALSELGQWDEDALALVIRIVETGDISDGAVAHLASVISVSAPALAIKLIAEQLRPQLRAAMAEVNPRPVVPDSASMEERAIAEVSYEAHKTLKRIFDRSNTDWYDLVTMVEASPLTWIEELWPLLRAALEHISTDSNQVLNRYRGDHLLSTNFEDEGEEARREYPILGATVAAIRAFAAADPKGFEVFVGVHQDSEAMSVQRLLAIGISEMAPVNPIFGLEYLLADPRRLQLEDFFEDERETKLLIRSIVPHLLEQDCARLERAILAASEYNPEFRDEDAKGRFDRQKWNRQFRLRLLQQVAEDRLTPATRKHVREELTAFPKFEDKRRTFELRTGSSTMSTEQMARASDEDIVKFLVQHPDSTDWGDIFSRRSGSINVSRAFADFAKNDPERAIRIFDRLDPATHQRPVAYAIEAIPLEKLKLDALFDLIKHLDANGFRSEDFRQNGASALRKRVAPVTALSDPVIDLLEDWLRTYRIVEDIERKTDDTTEEKEDRDESMLWAYGGIHILPQGTYTVLNAILFGLIARDPVTNHRLFQILTQHLERNDTLRVWESIAYDLSRNIQCCNAADAEAFIDALFARYPALLQKKGGMYLVAYALPLVNPAASQRWLTAIRDSGWTSAKLVFGELLVLHRLVTNDGQWAQAQLEALIAAPPAENHPDAQVLVGVVHAAVHLWKDVKVQEPLTALIRAGLLSENPQAHRAALDWFRVNEHPRLSAKTDPILETLIEGKALESVRSYSFLVDALLDLVADAPELVYAICRRILQAVGPAVANLANAVAADAEGIINIALTLQRLEEPHRSNGLALFEQLIEVDAYRAREVLMDVDRRPGRATGGPARRRRAKRNRGKMI